MQSHEHEWNEWIKISIWLSEAINTIVPLAQPISTATDENKKDWKLLFYDWLAKNIPKHSPSPEVWESWNLRWVLQINLLWIQDTHVAPVKQHWLLKHPSNHTSWLQLEDHPSYSPWVPLWWWQHSQSWALASFLVQRLLRAQVSFLCCKHLLHRESGQRSENNPGGNKRVSSCPQWSEKVIQLLL